MGGWLGFGVGCWDEWMVGESYINTPASGEPDDVAKTAKVKEKKEGPEKSLGKAWAKLSKLANSTSNTNKT